MDELEKLVTAVRASAKYKTVSPNLIRTIGARELTVRRSPKEAIKATKNKLHQVAGAYLDTSRPDYATALSALQHTADLRQTCRDIMQRHASTRERLPILDTFYSQIFAALPPIHSVLDVACGLNPLALPWLPLPPNATYLALDLYADMMAFLQAWFDMTQTETAVRGTAVVQDVVSQPPTQPVDLALILKTLPVLAQVDKTAVPRLLDSLNARHLLITFPVHSLGGRRKGMPDQYREQFAEWANGRSWNVSEFTFDTELAFLVTDERSA